MVAPAASAVNIHYLDHVMTVSEERAVEATEDIFAENGMKLVAKGYAINRSMRDRLLEHKLTKPLEDCMAVSDGVTGRRCADMATQMLDTFPVLRTMWDTSGGESPIQLMADSTYSGRLQTLLTVYNEHRPGKLEHAICVSLLALNLAHRLLPHDTRGRDVLLLAGLAHDVGELYIDPTYLQPGVRLGTKEWRHIAAHPVIAHSLLKDLSGLAGPASALIMDHHERLDGFGYPVGKRSGQLLPPAQILAVAEMLTGILERGDGMLQQGEIAVKLIHGEFSRDLIDVVSTSHRDCRHAEPINVTPALRDALQLSRAMGERLHGIVATQAAFKTPFERASPPFKALWQEAQARFESIRRAWSSTGLDVQPDGAWLLDESPAMQREVAIVLKEISWRLRELEREVLERTTRHAAGELPLLERYLQDVRQQAAPPQN